MSLLDTYRTLETSIIGFARNVYDTDWAQRGTTHHNDPFGRIYLLRSGRARVWHGGRTWELGPGQLTAIPAHTRSRYLCVRKMDLAWVHYNATVFGGVEAFAFLGWSLQVELANARVTAKAFDRLVSLSRKNEPAAWLEADGILRSLLSLFASDGKTRSSRPGREIGRLRPVFEYVDRNVGARIRLADLAALVHLQPTYFSNLFTRLTGVTPMQYVARRRAAVAQGMLRSSDEPLKAIASALAFSDEFHFSKAFKRVVGVAPSEYRRRGELESVQ